MMRMDQTNGGTPAASSDRAVWEHCRAIDAEPKDEAERFLDLAGYAESRIDDDDERARIAAWLADDPDAAADVAAAQTLAAAPGAASEAVVARAAALVRAGAEIIPFARPFRPRAGFRRFATWGTLAAGIAIAGWLGFALGSGTSLALGPVAQSNEDGFLGDLIDPSGGVLHAINDGLES